jgi:hypothetical protein
MPLNEFLDFLAPETGDLAQSDAGQAGFFARRMVIDPTLAHAEPGSNVTYRKEAVGLCEMVYGRHGESAAVGGEHIRLAIKIGKATHRKFEIALFLFYPDKFPPKFSASNTCCGASHERIENCFSGVSELSDPVHEKRQRLLSRMVAMLDIAGPYGMMSAAVPALFTLSMQNGYGFPPNAGPIARELWRCVLFRPYAKADERYAGLFQLRRMLPSARHYHPAAGLRNGVTAELDELFFGDSIEIDLRGGQRLCRTSAFVSLGVVGRIGYDAIDLTERWHYGKCVAMDK